MKCPDCADGKTFAFVSRRRREDEPINPHGEPDVIGESGWYPCMTCKGTQEISEEHAARITKGKAMRKDRVARRKSLREEAAALGITVLELSNMERGGQ